MRFDNFGGGPATSVLNNNGTIRPLFGTMTLSTDGAFDLDGTSGSGVVDVDDGTFLATALTLNVVGPLTDPFDGTIQIGREDTVDFTDPWQLGADGPSGSGLLEMNAIDGTATLSGGNVTVRGNATQLNVLSGTALFSADLDVFQGTMTVAPDASVHFSGDADFRSDSTFTPGSGYEMIVTGTTVFRQAAIDWDSPNATNQQTFIGPNGILEFQTDAIELGGNQFDGSVVVHGGVLSVITDNPWVMNGRLELNHVNTAIGRVSGQHLIVGNGVDTGPDATVDVGGAGETRITSQTTFRSDAELSINVNSVLRVNNNIVIESGAEVFGTGTLLNDGNLSIQNGVTIPGKLQNIDRLTLSGSTAQTEVTIGEYEQSGLFSRLTLEITHAATNMFDRLTVTGPAKLGGILDVDLASPFLPSLGDQFPIISAGSITGTFDSLQLPTLAAGNVWSVKYNPSSVILEVVSALSADFDQDGDVDGRDFLIWQRGGSPNGIGSGDLALWQAQYGSPLTAAVTVIPEPYSIALLLTGIMLSFIRISRKLLL